MSSSIAPARSCSRMISPCRGARPNSRWRSNFGTALKGLFLHVELIQPRRALERGYGRRNDFLAPDPGFSPAQYDSLALVYMVASVRAGFWLIPAFHAVLDEGIRNKHDDPQNFELEAFARSLDAAGRRIAHAHRGERDCSASPSPAS